MCDAGTAAAATVLCFFSCFIWCVLFSRPLFYFSYFVDGIIHNVRYIYIYTSHICLHHGPYHNFNENFMAAAEEPNRKLN